MARQTNAGIGGVNMSPSYPRRCSLTQHRRRSVLVNPFPSVKSQCAYLADIILYRLLSVSTHELPNSDSSSPTSGTSSIGSIYSPLSSSITPHSFIPGIEPSFSPNPFHRSLPFLLQDWLPGLPGLFTDTSELIRSPFQFLFPHFLVFGSVR